MQLVERLRLGGPNAAEVASEAADEIERLQRNHPNPADHRYWEGRYRDEKAEVERLRAVLDATHKLVTEGALVGFIPTEGTWAERLYKNQGSIHDAIKS